MAKEKKSKLKSWWSEFKSFISRGSVLDMAVGVVIGGAFSAIVTSVTNILLSVCTWAVPGGLNGLITVLPALSDSQKGLAGIGQTFSASDLTSIAESYVTAQFPGEEITPTIIQNGISDITSKYTLYGNVYVYNQCATINWGSFINAVISFLIIALTLFVIIKVFKYVKQKRLEFENNLREQYYLKHPEERPAPVEPGKPEPKEIDVLNEIKNELKQLNTNLKEKEQLEKQKTINSIRRNRYY